MKLVPLNGCVLVELGNSPYGDIPVPEKKYDSRTKGKILEVAEDLLGNDKVAYLVGRIVYWEEYKDSTRAEVDDKVYAFIKFEDIRGYETD